MIDPFLQAVGKDPWWPPNMQACADQKLTAATVRFSYIMVCELAFYEAGITIGEDDRTHDWSNAQVAMFQSIDYWKRFLSFTLLHELIHLMFKCKYCLNFRYKEDHGSPGRLSSRYRSGA